MSLAFARIVLQAPLWVLIDDTFGSLDGETLERVIDVFANELERTSVIHIGSSEARDPLFSRCVHLVKRPDASSGAGRDKLNDPANTASREQPSAIGK